MPRSSRRSTLDAVLAPRTVAVIGASRKPVSIGREILDNLLEFGFTGAVHPVNPKAASVQSVRAYPSVTAIPGPVDLAVVVVPKDKVLGVVEACGRKKVKGLVVITAGFRESGEEGARLESRLARLVARHGMRMVGPNCMGVINTDPAVRLNASFAAARPVPGEVGFMSQSGALGEAILSTAADLGLGLSHFVSLGNATDVSGNDLLAAWGDDPRVRLILLYLESFGDPRRFISVARRVTHAKPVIAVKSGRTGAGARAAVSHTGSLAGTEIATDTLLRRCGVIRVSTMNELFVLAQAFARQPLPAGRRVAVVTNAGGPGILATDTLIASGVEMSPFTPATRRKLRRVLPEEARVGNPVDMIASADGTRYAAVLAPVLADPTVDGVIVNFVTPVYIDALKVAESIVHAAQARHKPVLTCFMGKSRSEEAVRLLKDHGIPVYAFPEDAAFALAAMAHHREYLARPAGRIRRYAARREEAARVIREARRRGGGMLHWSEARQLVAAYGLPVVPGREVDSAAAAVAAARGLGYPVVLKASSPRFPHKTEVGGVRLDLRTGDEVAAAFEEMAPRLRRRDRGVRFFVQGMVKGGVETILGALLDPAFGPILMFGLGGTEVEILRDVTHAMCPVTDREAKDMLLSLKGSALLTGFRGSKPVDLESLAGWVGRLSQLMVDHPQIAELEINPLIVGPRGAPSGAVDVRVRVEAKAR